MARLGGFPEAQPFDPDAFYESVTSSGPGVVRRSLPPGPERDALLTEILQAVQADAEDLSTLIEELRDLMTGRDLTQLINSVVVPATTVAYTDGESLADGHSTSSWAAKIEYLVGVALSVDPDGDADTPPQVTERVRQLISDIFEADQVRMITDGLARADANDADRELLLQQLQLEYQVDRMPGYAVHLEHVDAEVFGRHRDYYVKGLGFNPADVIRVTRLRARWVNQTFKSALDALTDALNSGAPDPAAGKVIRKGFAAPTLWDPNDVAACTDIPVEQITAMLDFFSTVFGCQPEFRAPGDANRARTHPCIKLDDGTFLVPDSWSLSAVLHQRLAVEPKRSGYDAQKYYKHRQEAHERLVASTLEKVFGTSNVHSSQHYTLGSGGKGEIDALVCTEWPLVVEAKAIALTESGRRGAPGRVDKKLEEILGKALDQIDRALIYILDEGGRSFAPTESGRQISLLPDDIGGGTAIIVTFERIDPFASGGLAAAGDVNRPTWVVSLTDLLMVADILSDPAAFHHYAQTRAGMHSAEASAAAEADALGAYMLDRLRIVDQSTTEEAARILIGYSCESLNDFYTRQEMGLEATKPTAGVPTEITGALTNALGEPGWVECLDAVMMADSSLWKKWKRFRAKHRRGGTFVLNDRVSLVALPDGESSFERVDGAIRLNIPSRR
ncbi:hypothetical protein QQA43_30820 (plasmid) [Mycolicibacterium vanbaalenii]|uniref:hypothetical protein n=1 Tax=Mycolicibacterium vanbaalenii TaxID=110539 RepID=UPI001F160B9E|nr:hypothetical protein [Mycolicibacterium vanbaalenii]WND60043.1 hypothetical protein QQA43_30820 [Mycolicibacterium vanbaalenii]